MKITELLSKNTILLNIEGNQKEATINQLVDVLLKRGKYLTVLNSKPPS
jgi:PTS system fructose-specific IIC component